MAKSLIIVESPAKVKTIRKFLGSEYMVEASIGHIMDLPKKSLGVDKEHGYQPVYVPIAGKEKVIQGLQNAAKKAETVYLAPDPDREGEAIATHVAQVLKECNGNLKRIEFNEITPRAVREALQHPRAIDTNLYDAQQARRVLDRLVGYEVSPVLWKSVARGTSAGRVQSVALRLIVDREAERRAFVPEEYWLFKAVLKGAVPPEFRADLFKVDGKKPRIPDKATADALEDACRMAPFVVDAVEEKQRRKHPAPPFTTSTLQQTANSKLGYPAKRTMSIAQHLYEGMDLKGERGLTALITYMRTDSVRISADAVKAAATFIGGFYGPGYRADGEKGRHFKTKAGAQDAHEAIRPVDINITPDQVKGVIDPASYALYRLIWTRFVASQMAVAEVKDTIVTVRNGRALWRAKGERILFDGFLRAYGCGESADAQRNDDDDGETVNLPPLAGGESLALVELPKEQKFTQPEPRYTEATLVKTLEERGIGRPSTYAAIISTLLDHAYVSMEKKSFIPTALGTTVCKTLVEEFAPLMEVDFTARMEEDLDRIAEGKADWSKVMAKFDAGLGPMVEKAAAGGKRNRVAVETEHVCPKCGKPLVIRFGKSGEFLACTAYPKCEYASDFRIEEDGSISIIEKTKPEMQRIGRKCPQCGNDLVLKKARTGSRFIACSGYPDCRYSEGFSTGVTCPKCGKGTLVEKSSKRGKIFYSCGTWPTCDYAVWDWPVDQACPLCGSSILVQKTGRDGRILACPNKSCKFVKQLES